MLSKGSKLYNKDLGTYVKLEESEWSWWALKDDNLEVKEQMQVRLTDENARQGYLTYELVN